MTDKPLHTETGVGQKDLGPSGEVIVGSLVYGFGIIAILAAFGINYAPTEAFKYVMAGFAVGGAAMVPIFLIVFEVLDR